MINENPANNLNPKSDILSWLYWAYILVWLAFILSCWLAPQIGLGLAYQAVTARYVFPACLVMILLEIQTLNVWLASGNWGGVLLSGFGIAITVEVCIISLLLVTGLLLSLDQANPLGECASGAIIIATTWTPYIYIVGRRKLSQRLI